MAKTGAADATGKPTAWMVAALLVTHGVAKINNSLKKLFTGFSFWLGPGVGVSPTGTVICYVVSAAFLAFSVLHSHGPAIPTSTDSARNRSISAFHYSLTNGSRLPPHPWSPAGTLERKPLSVA